MSGVSVGAVLVISPASLGGVCARMHQPSRRKPTGTQKGDRFDNAATVRHKNRKRRDEMWRHPHERLPFADRISRNAELQMLQIPQSAMNDL